MASVLHNLGQYVNCHQNVVDMFSVQHGDHDYPNHDFPVAPGTRIDVAVLRGTCSVEPKAIRVIMAEQNFRLSSLDQLKGLVHIRDARDAIHFVRLRQTHYCWDNEVCEASTRDQSSGASAGTRRERDEFRSGIDGVLSGKPTAWAGFNRARSRGLRTATR